MTLQIIIQRIVTVLTLSFDKGEKKVMAEGKKLTPEDRETRILSRLRTYPILSKSLFGSFLIGTGAEIEVALKSLVSKGLVKQRVVPTGSDVVVVYYLSALSNLVEPFFEQ